MNCRAAVITRADLRDSAMLFAVLHDQPTFSARDFSAFSEVAAIRLDEELANEVLLEVVELGAMREIGPGVYALKVKGVQGGLTFFHPPCQQFAKGAHS